MSIRAPYVPTESQIFLAHQWRGFCANPGQFLYQEFEELKADPHQYFLIRQRHFNTAYLDNLVIIESWIVQEISELADRLHQVSRRVFPSSQDIASGRICPLDRLMGITQIGLAGASALGVVGLVAGSIAAMPPVVALSATLAFGSALGVHAAASASSLAKRVEGEEERRAQINSLTGIIHTQQQTNQSQRQIVQRLEERVTELTGSINGLRRQITSLEQNIERLQAGILQFSVQNEHYTRIGEQFSLHLEAFRRGSREGSDALNAKIAEFTTQLTASKELWDTVSRDTSIFKEGQDRQIAELNSLISQLLDPRHTLARLEERRLMDEQLSRVSSTLASYQKELHLVVQDLGRKEGEVRARDQLLRELEQAHRQILAGYGQQNAAQAERNAELSQIVQRISGLVNRSLTEVVVR